MEFPVFSILRFRTCQFVLAALALGMAFAAATANAGNLDARGESATDPTTTIAGTRSLWHIAATQPSEPAAIGHKVSIAKFAFGPQSITIKAGESVTWSNDDGPSHTVTFKDGSPAARSLAPGQTFTRAFDKPGTYDYFCSFHPFMTGKLIVTP
jgi:plastocyanin